MTSLARTTLVATVLLVSGCSSGSETASVPTTPIPTTPATTTEPPGHSDPGAAIDPSDSASPTPAPTQAEGSPHSDGGNWLAHGTMTSEQIELIWSEIEGHEVTYYLYRFDASDQLNLETVPLTEASRLYVGPATAFSDVSVSPNRFYTYFLTAEADGASLSRRWTTGLSTDDTDPPSPITGLAVTKTDEGVLLTWDPSYDEVEFSAYSVSELVDGEPQYLGGGTEPEQSSFLDNRPDLGPTTYLVQAADFHDNRTEGARIDYPGE